MLLRDYIQVQFLLVVWVEFWVSHFGLILVAIRPLGFQFSLTLSLVARLFFFFSNLDFIHILIAKYTIGTLKAMGKFSIYLFPCFYHMVLINYICDLKIFWYS